MQSSEEESDDCIIPESKRRTTLRRAGPIVKPTPLSFPKHIYGNHSTDRVVTPEWKALECLKREWMSSHDNSDPFITVNLDQFVVYRPSTSKARSYELTGLDHLAKSASSTLMFSGILSLGNVTQYVEDVEFETLSIDGYGNEDDPGVDIWIRSIRASQGSVVDIWYLLRASASEYRAFYNPFVWMAAFCRHSIDFMDSFPPDTVKLLHFENNFALWLRKRFPGNADLKTWMTAINKIDFRQSFNAYSTFLLNQAWATDDNTQREKRFSHPVWGDVGIHTKPTTYLNTLEDTTRGRTIATPFVSQCFKDMYFGAYLKATEPVPSIRQAQARRMSELGFTGGTCSAALPQDLRPRTISPRIRTGDVISVAGEKGPWNSQVWYAYVQNVRETKSHEQRFDVIWLYKPEETAIENAKYLVPKELFFSDLCNCKGPREKQDQVIAAHTVAWNPTSLDVPEEFIIRTKYYSDGGSFTTLKRSDLTCNCGSNAEDIEYQEGEPVYYRPPRERLAEPAIVHKYNVKENKVILRILMRTGRDCLQHQSAIVPANELTWTDKFVAVHTNRLHGSFRIKFIPKTKDIPFPYNSGGRYHYWYISSRLVHATAETYDLQWLRSDQRAYGKINQGAVSTEAPKASVLPGLSLFSGGGGLDRGLEASGAVKFTHNIDWCELAVLTQKANSKPGGSKCLHGSVDDLLHAVLSNNQSVDFPSIGSISFVCGGSPCQGFSKMQRDRFSDQSLRNASHITTFCSFVDIYRPHYALLENVVSIVDNIKSLPNDKILCQMIATFVAMGYQTQYWIAHSWNHGSCQHRARIFIAIAAPGLDPMRPPPPSHADPTYEILPKESLQLTARAKVYRPLIRSLGYLPNGERFGARDADIVTPFKAKTVKDAIHHLPDIGYGSGRICIPVPDHRLHQHTNANDQAKLRHVPLLPHCSGYQYAVDKGLMPLSLQTKHKAYDRSFTRVHPEGLIPTINTAIRMQDAHAGQFVHYQQPRQITVQEARIAQGWPDDEIVIGNPAEQMEVIGNGVDRNISTHIGFELRYAWERSCVQKSPVPPASKLGLRGTEVCLRQEIEVSRKSRDLNVRVVVRNQADYTKTKDDLESVVSETLSHLRGTEKEMTLPLNPVKRSRSRETGDEMGVDRSAKRTTRNSGVRTDFVTPRWDKVVEREVRRRSA